MATIAIQPLEVKGTISGNAPQVITLPEGASQTFKVGAILTLTAGYVVEAAADSARVLGVACEPGQNLASNGLKEAKVIIANDDTIFVGNLAGKASSVLDIGLAYSIAKDGTTSNWTVDGTDLTNRICIIQKLDPRDTLGDTNHRVHFIFHRVKQVLGYTS